MKIGGILFLGFGLLWAILGFVTYASDIQIGIALTGVCMAGIGVILLALDSLTKKIQDLTESKSE